ncbi:hypothetical protein PoB_004243400 [Plakobranchus ocellatus]|uniref:Uncharacterized protein n=1 Tax=Plakobranchus ocellatus TaxID=259542 RepID=A0AAV4BC39_9GAST|nr:hypothetical protein PoB_004243400 [Plakobranchus ocellatus]
MRSLMFSSLTAPAMRAGLITQGLQATVRVHKLCLKWVKMWINLFRWGQFMNECTNVGNYRLKSYAQMSCTHVKDSIDTKYKQVEVFFAQHSAITCGRFFRFLVDLV